jgi:N-acetylmuramoyl-L-alanine amidase
MTVRAASWAFLGALLAGLSAGLPAGTAWAADPLPPPAESFPVATAVRLGGDETLTRFVMDLSRGVDFHVFTLADPYRAVVDIPEVTFQLPSNVGESGRGLIKAFRFGLMMPGGSRLVFDLAKPARIEKAFVVDAEGGAPARLVIELASTDRESFLRKIALDDKLLRAHLATGDSATKDLQGQGFQGQGVQGQGIQGQDLRATHEPHAEITDPRPLVVLDPGHGGIDTGTRSPAGEMEKTIVLEFALRLRDQLERTGKYRLLMTRTDDTFVPLADRVRIARNAGASLFISIHADSLPHREGNAQGATVYTLSETASDPEAAKLAEEENRADVIAGVDLKSEPNDVAGILIDLAQRETKTFSVQFAHKLVADLKTATRMHKEPIKSAGFRVLRAPDVPSVLVELGYVSNRDDLKSLVSDSWRNRTVNAMAEAIGAYFSTHVAGNRAGMN